METKIKPKRITDFKNDLVFKFMLSDLNDSRCYYLLKTIIEGITGVKCQELVVLNSEVNPKHLTDKDMVLDVRVKTDEGKLIDIEMQNSALTKEFIIVFKSMEQNDGSSSQSRRYLIQ